MRSFLSALLILSAVSIVGCTRDAGEQSQISIQFPGSASLAKVARSVSAQSGSSFDATPPATLADIDCYAVFVGADEDGMRESSCKNGNGDTLFKFGPAIGVFDAGTSATLEVKSGANRRIMIAGLHKLSGNCKGPDLRDLDVSNYSYPYLLSSLTRDLAPGDVEVEMPLTADFSSAKKMASCSFFNSSGGGGGGVVVSGPADHFMLTATPVATGSVVTPLDSIPYNANTNIILQLVDAQNRAVADGAGTSLSLSLGYPILTFDGTNYTTSMVLDASGKSSFTVYVGNNELVTSISYSYSGSVGGVPNSGQLVLPVGPYAGEPVHLQVQTIMAISRAAVGVCLPVQYSLGDGPTGVLHPSAVNVNFIPTAAGGTFYSAPDCTGPTVSNVTIPAGKVMSYLYFLPSVSGTSTFGFSGIPVNASSVPLSLYGSPALYVP